MSLIQNTDGKAYYIKIRVNTAASLPSGSVAKLLIYNAPSDGTKVADVSLLATGDTSASAIPAGVVWRIDLYIFIPEGSTISGTPTASLQLIYSPSDLSSETPPTVPPP